MKIILRDDTYLESDEGPRDTPFHKRIVAVRPIPNTLNRTWLDLECGHYAVAVGNLAHAEGRVLCTRCRDEVQP